MKRRLNIIEEDRTYFFASVNDGEFRGVCNICSDSADLTSIMDMNFTRHFYTDRVCSVVSVM